ncbi:hypothetical protein T484DRAFT_1882167, partial [Baffinella frigidus]
MKTMMRNANDIGLEIKRMRIARATGAAYEILGGDPLADHEELKVALMERDPIGTAAHRPPPQAELAYLAAKHGAARQLHSIVRCLKMRGERHRNLRSACIKACEANLRQGRRITQPEWQELDDALVDILAAPGEDPDIVNQAEALRLLTRRYVGIVCCHRWTDKDRVIAPAPEPTRKKEPSGAAGPGGGKSTVVFGAGAGALAMDANEFSSAWDAILKVPDAFNEMLNKAPYQIMVNGIDKITGGNSSPLRTVTAEAGCAT